jgi:hypothetical protein
MAAGRCALRSRLNGKVRLGAVRVDLALLLWPFHRLELVFVPFLFFELGFLSLRFVLPRSGSFYDCSGLFRTPSGVGN